MTAATSEASMEEHISGMEQWTLQNAEAGELFRVRSPPIEGHWPIAILQRGQLNLELRTAVRWLSQSGGCQGQGETVEFKLAGDAGAEFELAWSQVQFGQEAQGSFQAE